MVIGHFFTVADPACIHSSRILLAADSGSSRNKIGGSSFHIIGKIPAVCSGVGTELLFIEGLEIVKSLLCCVTQQTVCIPLECGQIVEGGRIFCLFLSFHGKNGSGFALTGTGNRLGFRFIFGFLRSCGETAVQIDRVKRFRDKSGNFGLPLSKKSQCR